MSSKLPLDSSYDLEQQFILRMTDAAAAESLSADIEAGVSFKDNFTLEFKPDMRHASVRYNGQVYQGRLMDLPCVIESLKTTDKRSFYKTADICQMMVCTQGDETGPLRGTAAYLDDRTRSWGNTLDTSRETREFQFLHGITPPLKNVLRRRFRKSRRKRLVDMPKIEKEVKQLLRADLQAVGVKWQVIWSDPQSSGQANLSAAADADSDASVAAPLTNPDAAGRRKTADDEEEEEEEDGTRPFPVDRRDVFGDISSSSSSSSIVDSSDSSCGTDDEHNATISSNTRSPKSPGRPVFRRDASRPDESSLIPNSIGQFNEAVGLSTLKNELAAELLLSDSGDEHTLSPEIAAATDGPDDEDDQQATAAAHLVAHGGSCTTLDDGTVSVVVEDLNDVEEEDDVVHPGGELLDEASLIDLDSAATLSDMQSDLHVERREDIGDR